MEGGGDAGSAGATGRRSRQVLVLVADIVESCFKSA